MATTTTTTLFDLVLRMLTELGTLRTGTVTGGTTSTIIDTNMLDQVDDAYYDNGTAFIIWDAAGASAAPQGEFSIVDTSDKVTSTLNLRSALTVAPGAGDKYGVANSRFPLDRVVEKINMRLFSMIYIPQNDVSLTTVGDQTEYSLPAAAAVDLRQVFIARSTDSADYDEVEWNNYRIAHADTAGTHKLVFDRDFPSGYRIRLVYGGRHPDLRVASDKLSEFVHPDIVVYSAASDALQEYKDRTRLRTLDSKIEDLRLKAERSIQMHPLPPLPLRKARTLRISRSSAINPPNITNDYWGS